MLRHYLPSRSSLLLNKKFSPTTISMFLETTCHSKRWTSTSSTPTSSTSTLNTTNNNTDASKTQDAAAPSAEKVDIPNQTASTSNPSPSVTSSKDAAPPASPPSGYTADDLSIELEVEPVRWDLPVYNEDIVDEKGQYIVSKFPWKTGELAYTTPAPPAPHEARFGYQVVVIKKPQSYWSWYRRANFFSFTHVWYQLAFALGVCWLLTWIQLETNYLYTEMKRPGNLAADQLGKGDANRHTKKITVTPEERDEVLQAMQTAFLDGKDLTSRASKDYRMKKIPRPKEFNAQDYMRN